jgi:peptide-methionine (S)-S-oxide reductase
MSMHSRSLHNLGLLALLLWCAQGASAAAPPAAPAPASPSAPADNHKLATATFAGGCFWCMQPPYDKLPGVVSTTVGYTGGHLDKPSYEQVSSGGTGHRESIEVVYDPAKVGYDKLLAVFWHNIDPTDDAGQFCDHGEQYRSAIFFHDEAQRHMAEESKRAIAASGRIKAPIVTDILPAAQFYPAEGYHQKYYVKSAIRYSFYRFNCGRDRRLSQIWGDLADSGH